MTRLSLIALVLAYAGAASTQAAIINVGYHDLLPNTPNQSVFIYATAEPDELVTGFNLRMQIGDGHPDFGGGALLEPILQNVDFNGGVWDAFPNTKTGGSVAGYPMYAQASVVFDPVQEPLPPSAISPSGLVAELIVDTTGIFSGSYALDLARTHIGADSVFIGAGGIEVPIGIVNGQLNIVPEPSALTILLLCGSAMACGTSWARRRRTKAQESSR